MSSFSKVLVSMMENGFKAVYEVVVLKTEQTFIKIGMAIVLLFIYLTSDYLVTLGIGVWFGYLWGNCLD